MGSRFYGDGVSRRTHSQGGQHQEFRAYSLDIGAQGIRFIRADPLGLKVYSHGSDADGAGRVGVVIRIQVSGSRISRGAFTDVVGKGTF